MPLSARHSSSIAVLVAGAFFMENLDGTVIATALPQMAQSFHVGPVSLNVGMTAYMTMGMGVAAGAIALRISALLRHGSASNPTIPDFHLAFVLIGLIALVSVLDFLRLDAAAGAVVSGHLRRG